MKNIIENIKNFGNLIADWFGFMDFSDFMDSMVHTKLLLFTLPTSILLFAVIEEWLGITSAMFVSFGLMAVLELVTGLWGARALGYKWSSRKFSRFGLKILVWLCLIAVTNSFKVSYEDKVGIQEAIIYQMFHWIHGTLVVYIALEYFISILENLGKITGQRDNRFLQFLKKLVDRFFQTAENMTDLNKISEGKVRNSGETDLDSTVIESNEEEGESDQSV